MAESLGDPLSMSLQKLDDELTCPVCTEHFKDPKVLPCLHYYCKTCIADLIKRAKGRPFNCPECRREAKAANNDPEIFPTAFFVNRMEEVFSVMKKAEPKEDVKCENCSELPSIAFCHQCSEYICTECAKAHKKMHQFSSHEVVSIESFRTTISKSAASAFPMVQKEVKCGKHKDEPLKLYCRDCHMLVCRDCIIIDHKDHGYVFVVDAAPKCKSDIKAKAESVEEISVGLKSTVKSLNDSEKKLNEHSTATMKAIDDAVDRITSKLMQKRKELKEEACRKFNEVKKEIATKEKNAQLAVGEVESLLEFMIRNLDKATDQEVLSLEKQMDDQVNRVSQLYSDPADKFLCLPKIPWLKVQCGVRIEQVIESDISITDASEEEKNVAIPVTHPVSSNVTTAGATSSSVITLPNRRKLTLKRGDIVREEADILVNAANRRLDHDGGVAGALNATSEWRLQKYSNKYMKKRDGEEIPAGEVAVTHGGGNLKCQHVIHAVGPDIYSYSQAECERLVKVAISNTLKVAEQLNATSIALPAISCGLFGVSKNLVARSIIGAIRSFNYTKPPPVLSDIRIVLLDESTHTCFVQEL